MNTARFAEVSRWPVRLAACLLVGAWIALPLVVTAAPPSGPKGASAVTLPVHPAGDPDCFKAAGTGGAAPPTLAGDELQADVRRIVHRYRGSPLTPATAQAIRAALCVAGLWAHPGLGHALADSGLSVKQIDALAPMPAALAPTPELTASSAGRRVPPRE